ncbi:hypothetical protein DPMN_073031 [Dreissena polymorpha]|uniref:Uncharacterized protein n=1 Tax=Dreissena polymorpha TaxID=45954 RepID=A0A9D4BYA9_DREPO|nr:hypothetical protein DPMN_073031 [Dreissena polymorpha]
MTVFYNVTKYETTAKELKMKNPNSVSGTIKLHALFAAHNQLYTAKVSYYCEACSKGEYCGHWKIDTVPEKHNVSNEASLRECSLKRKLVDHEGKVDENRKKYRSLTYLKCAQTEMALHISQMKMCCPKSQIKMNPH